MVNWQELTHSGKHHAILFIDTVITGYKRGFTGGFFGFSFSPTKFRQYNGARWLAKEEVEEYVASLKILTERDPELVIKKAKSYHKLNVNLLAFANRFKDVNFSRASNKDICTIFTNFMEKLSDINAVVYAPKMFDKFLTDEVTQIISKYETDFEKQKAILGKIFTMDYGLESHYMQKSLLRIGKMLKTLYPKNPKVRRLILVHKKRYAYNGIFLFRGKPLEEKDVVQSARKIMRSPPMFPKKLDLEPELVKLGLTVQERKKVEVLRTWTFYANNDDEYVMGGLCALWPMWHEIARRFQLPFDDFVEMRVSEVQNGLLNNVINRGEIKKRKKASAIIMDEGGERVLAGANLSIYEKLEAKKDNVLKGVLELKGQVAVEGHAVGKVKVLRSITEMNKIQRGDVLVAVYTYPAIVVAMEKAVAIVTEHGGLLSHAAIVSRELKKPCIVGVQDATKILSDGEVVEIDANKGIIKRKIKS